MSTKIYGAGDDLIEFEGEVGGEVGSYDTETLLICSDGTLLTFKYGDLGIWKANLIKKGELFDNIDICDDPDAKIYSDIVSFKDGLKWSYSAEKWSKVT